MGNVNNSYSRPEPAKRMSDAEWDAFWRDQDERFPETARFRDPARGRIRWQMLNEDMELFFSMTEDECEAEVDRRLEES